MAGLRRLFAVRSLKHGWSRRVPVRQLFAGADLAESSHLLRPTRPADRPRSEEARQVCRPLKGGESAAGRSGEAETAQLPSGRRVKASAGAMRRKRWYQAHWVEWGDHLPGGDALLRRHPRPGRTPPACRATRPKSSRCWIGRWSTACVSYGKFPLWNPYIQTGIPFVADPMLHVYNPVVTLPVLLFGVRAGFKLGIYFSFLIGALGMWKLADTLGLGRAARLWTALMFAFAGQPAARFFQGQYLFVLGFAYIPWIVASLLKWRASSGPGPIHSPGQPGQ